MKKYFIFFIIAWFIFVAHAIYTKHAVYGDGNGYWVYTQSLYFDKSLDFSKVYDHLIHFQGRDYEFSRIFWNYKYDDPYSIGTGIVWLPSMFIMNLFSADRFSLTYELGPGLTGIFCMLLGLYVIERYLSKYYSGKVVFWTILTLFFGSNVFYYTAFEPALSHQPAFLIVALLLLLIDSKKPNLFLIGLLSGFLASIRIGDVILLLPVIYKIRKEGVRLIYFILGAIGGYMPQLINQSLQYSNLATNPYVNGENGSFTLHVGQTLATLFSPKRGFVLWTPLYVLGLYGLFKAKKYLLTITTLTYLLSACMWSGGLSAGFGIRLVFSATPYFAVGVAEIFNKMKDRNIFKYFSFFSIYNLLLVYGFYFLRWKDLP